MPFTLSHPAIIFPLLKSKYKLSFTALVVGSLVPDFEFFLQMREVDNIGHHWYGVFLFDLPMGLMCCFLFHNLLKNIFVNNLPDTFGFSLFDSINFDWNKYAMANIWWVLLSLFIGISSHIFVDGFTHYDGFFVMLLPMLSNTIYILNVSIPVYLFLQIVFSVIGILIVAIRLLKNISFKNLNAVKGEKNKFYWPVLCFTFITIVSIRLIFWPAFNSFWGIFMAIMGGVMYSSLLVSYLYQKTFLKNYL